MTSSLPRFSTTDLLKMPTGVHLELSFTHAHTHKHIKPFDTHTYVHKLLSEHFWYIFFVCQRSVWGALQPKDSWRFQHLLHSAGIFLNDVETDIKLFFSRSCHTCLCWVLPDKCYEQFLKSPEEWDYYIMYKELNTNVILGLGSRWGWELRLGMGLGYG